MANQTSTTNYKRLAEQVQLARRNKRLSIKKVSLITNLPEATIRALEHPAKYDLPSANVRGLYRTYGEAVGLTSRRVTDLLGEEESSNPTFSIPTLKQIKRTIILSNVAAKAAVVGVILVVAGYVGLQGLGLFSSPQLHVTSPSEQISIVQEAEFSVEGSAESKDTVLINGQPVTLDANSGDFNQNVYLQNGYNTLRVESVNSFSRSSVQEFTLIFTED